MFGPVRHFLSVQSAVISLPGLKGQVLVVWSTAIALAVPLIIVDTVRLAWARY